MTGRGASPDFDTFVRSRGPSLFRTAALLTHDEAAAHDLLVGALAQAYTTWRRAGTTPESFVRSIVVTRYARSRRNDPRDSLNYADSPGHRHSPSRDSPLRWCLRSQRS